MYTDILVFIEYDFWNGMHLCSACNRRTTNALNDDDDDDDVQERQHRVFNAGVRRFHAAGHTGTSRLHRRCSTSRLGPR